VVDEAYRDRHGTVEPGQYVLLSVSDDGIGMDPAVREHAFEPFFTTKPSGVGTGLGLSTVYGIVAQSGGHVWLYSERGKGTVVRLYLPRVPAPEAEARTREPAEKRGTEEVLLVEDEGSVRTLVRAILQRRGYQVVEAPDAERALAIAEEHEGEFVLVVTDVVMPGISGPDLVARLRARQPGLRVLYMSGYADDGEVRRAIADSGTAYLQKPFTPDALGRAVRELLDAPPAGRSGGR
jgi:two-component system cell cycle sensor histidine kinase/response regulator CckA